MAGKRERSRVVREALKTEGNRRFLRSLPVFKTVPKLPAEMHEQLQRLELVGHKRPPAKH